MHALPNPLVVFNLVGRLFVCLAIPPLFYHYLGPAAGTLGVIGAAALWYSQYRLPHWHVGSHALFWLATAGYGVIGLTLLACLSRLLG